MKTELKCFDHCYFSKGLYLKSSISISIYLTFSSSLSTRGIKMVSVKLIRGAGLLPIDSIFLEPILPIVVTNDFPTFPIVSITVGNSALPMPPKIACIFINFLFLSFFVIIFNKKKYRRDRNQTS